MSRGKGYDEQPVFQASISDLDQKAIEEFLKDQGYKEKTAFKNRASLREYKRVFDHGGRTYPTCGALLLFGKDPLRFFPEGYVVTSQFKGDNRGEVIASLECKGPLVQQIDAAYQFIISRLSRKMTFSGSGVRRKDTVEIPEIAIREALVNAACHRDYAIKATSKIGLYQSKLEFFSPGIFPGPLALKELESGISYIRNHVVCRVLRESGVIEKLGTGLRVIFSSFREAGLARPDIFEGDGYVKYLLPKIRDEGVVLESIEEKILKLAEQLGEISVTDILKKNQSSRATVGRVLSGLVKTKKLVRYGKGRGVRYRLPL